jgi:hypothetical protein
MIRYWYVTVVVGVRVCGCEQFIMGNFCSIILICVLFIRLLPDWLMDRLQAKHQEQEEEINRLKA